MNHKKDYVWGALSKFIPEGIYLVTTMVLARMLTPEDFGIIGVISIIFTVANTMTDAGLGGSLIKEKNLSDIDCSSIFCFNTIISIILYIIVFFTANFIESYYNVYGLANVTRVISLTFVINSFAMVPKSLLSREIQFEKLFKISLCSVIVASVVSIVLAFCGAKVYAIVGYRLVLTFVTACLAISYSNFHISFKFSFDSLKRLLPFGIFTTLSTIVDSVYENLLAAIFGKTSGMGNTGYFYQAKKTIDALQITVTSTIGQVAFSVLSKIKENREALDEETLSLFRFVVLFFTPLLIVISVFSREIVILMYGAQWADSGIYLKLLIYAAIFMVMENLNRTFIKSLGKGQPILYVSLIKRTIGILVVFATFYFNPVYLVHAYIVTAFLGFLINQVAYSHLSRTSFKRSFKLACFYMCPNFIILIILNFVELYDLKLFFKLIIDTGILTIYYFVLCKYLHIPVSSILKSIRK